MKIQSSSQAGIAQSIAPAIQTDAVVHHAAFQPEQTAPAQPAAQIMEFNQ